MAGLGPEGSRGVLTARLAWGEHPLSGLPLCGPWHPQVTCQGWAGIFHALPGSSSSPAQPPASATCALSNHATKHWEFFVTAKGLPLGEIPLGFPFPGTKAPSFLSL